METKAKFLTTKTNDADCADDSADMLGPLSIPLPFSPVPIYFSKFLVLYFSIFVLGTKLVRSVM